MTSTRQWVAQALQRIEADARRSADTHLIPLTLPADASEERHSYYLRGRHITAFFVSFLDLEDYFTETDFQKRLAETPAQAKLEDSVDCGEVLGG